MKKQSKPYYDGGIIDSVDDLIQKCDDNKIDSLYKNLNKIIPPLKDLNYWNNGYTFPYEKKNIYKSFMGDDKWNKQVEEVRKMVEELVELEKRKEAGKYFPVRIPEGGLGANSSRQMTAGERVVILSAVDRFNTAIPREGIPIDWSPAPLDKGILWGLVWQNATVHMLSARITVNGADTIPPIRISGVRRIKKSEGVLSEMIIERLYVIDDRGNETTLFSII